MVKWGFTDQEWPLRSLFSKKKHSFSKGNIHLLILTMLFTILIISKYVIAINDLHAC